MREFVSGFAADLKGMIDFRIALHYAESTFMERSRQFDLFCVKNYPKATVVTEGLAVGWLRMDENTSPGVIHARAAFLRGFARYQKAIGKNAYILPDAYISGKSRHMPAITHADDRYLSCFRFLLSDDNRKIAVGKQKL